MNETAADNRYRDSDVLLLVRALADAEAPCPALGRRRAQSLLDLALPRIRHHGQLASV